LRVVEGEIPVTLANEAALRGALESAGVEFIDENGGGPGVRLKRAKREARKKAKMRGLDVDFIDENGGGRNVQFENRGKNRGK
jgi:hypothetical protein